MLAGKIRCTPDCIWFEHFWQMVIYSTVLGVALNQKPQQVEYSFSLPNFTMFNENNNLGKKHKKNIPPNVVSEFDATPKAQQNA